LTFRPDKHNLKERQRTGDAEGGYPSGQDSKKTASRAPVNACRIFSDTRQSGMIVRTTAEFSREIS